MKVNVNNLKMEVSSFNKLLESYEGNCLNYYNVLSSFSFDWNDTYSKNFFDEVKKEKISYQKLLLDLKDLKDIYSYLVNKYSSLGNKIEVNLDKKDKVLDYFTNAINSLNNVIYKFNCLDLSFCPSEAISIRYQRDKVIKARDKMKSAKDEINKIYSKINEIEAEVKNKVNKLSVSYIRTTSINGMY